jgi:hypothetical protein
MSWSWVALYTLTGTFTSPNAMEPFQIERMQVSMPGGPLAKQHDEATTRDCPRRTRTIEVRG